MEYFGATVFAMAFLLLTYSIFTILDNRKLKNSAQDDTVSYAIIQRDDLVCIVLFTLYSIEFIYKYYNGLAYSLYESIEDLKRPFLVNFILSYEWVRWYCLGYSLFVLSGSEHSHVTQSLRGSFRQKIFIGILIITSAAVFVDSFISTAKGLLLLLFFMLLMWQYLRNKRVSILIFSVLLTVGVLFSAYTYIVRYYGTVRGKFEVAQVSENIDAFFIHRDEMNSLGIQGSLDRLNYYDGLMLAISDTDDSDKGDYSTGSLVEVYNLIPRPIWPDRPLYSLNHYLTIELWKMSGVFSETPIGRIGEAAYVLGYFGIIYAVIYGVLFYFIWSNYAITRYASSFGIYIMLWTIWIFPDAYLFYNLKNILFFFVNYFVIKIIVSSYVKYTQVQRSIV